MSFLQNTIEIVKDYYLHVIIALLLLLVIRKQFKLLKQKIEVVYDRLVIFLKSMLVLLLEESILVFLKIKAYIIKSLPRSPNIYDDLTALETLENNEVYEKALNEALINPTRKNIALTGPYGSGKSSILKTFQKTHPEYKYLNISLASFNPELQPNEAIEISILQQIFYFVKPSSIPDSRFKRIKPLGGQKLFIKAATFTIWLTALYFLFKRDTLKAIPEWPKFYNGHSKSIYYSAILIALAGILFILYYIFRIYNDSKFNKVNLTSGEIEIGDKSEKSILNKHLDELLYFFEVTRYNVVIIEDLDRFKNHDIFTKLREINTLINNSLQIQQKVVFIYALGDDIFKDEHRTKFFDFIIPVMPVINASNSAVKLTESLNREGISDVVSKEFISQISRYIIDMRLLKNISNELKIYKGILNNSKLDFEKLLAVIIYKNILPDDFAELHSKKGLVYTFFNNKEDFISDRRLELQAQVELETIKIAKIKQNHVRNLTELRAIYLYAIFEKLPANSTRTIELQGTSYNFTDLKKDKVFEILKQQERIIYQTYNGGSRNLDMSFTAIGRDVDPEYTYFEREEAITLFTEHEIERLESSLASVKNELEYLNYSTIKDLIQNTDLIRFTEDFSKHQWLVYLIRNGYLDEQYHYYISYFYEGLLTKEGLDFLMSVQNHQALPYGFKFDNVDEVIKRINVKDFLNPETLNQSLVDCLLDNPTQYEEQLKEIVKQLTNGRAKSLSFIDNYFNTGSNPASLIILITKAFPSFWEYLEFESNLSQERKEDYYKFILYNVDIKNIVELNRKNLITNFLSHKKDFFRFVSDCVNYGDLEAKLNYLNVKFISIVSPDTNKDLFDYIYRHNLYELNFGMIEIILNKKSALNNLEKSLENSPYSTIKKSVCNSLIEYVDRNLEEYVKNVVLPIKGSNFEDLEYLLILLNSELSEETKELLINKTETVIISLNDVQEDQWPDLLKHSKVEPNWFNVLEYYQFKEKVIDEILIEFLNKHENYNLLGSKLFEENNPLTQEDLNKFQIDLLSTPAISDISFNKLLNSFSDKLDEVDFSNLSSDKVDSIIKHEILSLTDENYLLLKEKFSYKHLNLLEKNKVEFLEDIETYELDDQELQLLFVSNEFSIDEKLQILESVNAETIDGNSSLADVITTTFKNINTSIAYEKVVNALNFSQDLPSKIQFLCNQLIRLSKSQTTSLLTAAGEPYSKITGSDRPLIENTNFNLELARKLYNIGYISSYTIHKEKLIRINTRRK